MRAKRFQMQSWCSRELRWEPMEEGAAPSVWQPRPTEAEAIAKCLSWTGFHCIPSMQVVDLASRRVVWRGLMEPYYYEGVWGFVAPEAGPPIAHEDEPLARQLAKRILSGQKPIRASEPNPEQEVLF